jgi:hypothetical protein
LLSVSPNFTSGHADGDIAARDQPDATPESGAMHAGDGRLGQLVQGSHQAGEGEGIVAIGFLAGSGHATHPVEIGAGGERRAFAFQDDHAQGCRRDRRLQRTSQRRDQHRVERVVQLRSVHAQAADGAFAQAQQGMAHGRSVS